MKQFSKNARRIACIVLTLALAVSAFPLFSFAQTDEVITELAVTGFTVPKAGQTVAENIANIKVPDGANYHITGISWLKDDYSVVMENDEKFEGEKAYGLDVAVAPNEGYRFDFMQTSVFTINGSDELTGSSYVDGKSAAVVCADVITAPAPINPIAIEGYKAPTAGQTVAENIADIKLPDGVKYTIVGITWLENYDTPMDETDTFKAGVEYGLDVAVMPLEGYEFAFPIADFIVNGSDSIHSKASEVKNKMQAVVCVDVCVDYLYVDKIELEGYAAPTAGQTVAEASAGLKLPEGVDYTIYDMIWFRVENGEFFRLFDDDVFEEGKTYTLGVQVETKENFAFTENVAFTINGSDELVDFDISSVDNGTTGAVIKSKDHTIPVHVCALEKQNGKDASCTEDGYNAYYSCECGKSYADENGQMPIEDIEAWKTGDGKIPAGHKWSDTYDKANADADKHYHVCTQEGCGAKDDGEAHTPGAPATEDTDQVCTVCGYVIAPATGPVEPDNPPTGDNSLAIIASVCAISFIGTAAVAFRKKSFVR